MTKADLVVELKARVEALEHHRRKILNALDMALTLGDFQEEINQRFTPRQLFEEIQKRIHSVFQFESYAFYFVDQTTSDFNLSVCVPRRSEKYFEDEFDFLIDHGFVAWAIREKKGITVPTRDHSHKLFLHPIASQARTRGLFIGRFGQDQETISDVCIYLLSTILRNAANALESTEHYECITTGRMLRESKERIEAILESLPVGILIIDPADLRVVDANPLALKTLGASLDDLVNRRLSHFLTSDTPFSSGPHRIFGEGTIVRKSRHPLPVYWTSIGTALGDQDRIVISFIDVSEKRKLEHERNLREKFLGIIELSGAICHELNQPLQVVMGNAEFLMMQLDKDWTYYDNIKDIKAYSEKMGLITKKLMEITHYETKEYLRGHILDIDMSSD